MSKHLRFDFPSHTGIRYFFSESAQIFTFYYRHKLKPVGVAFLRLCDNDSSDDFRRSGTMSRSFIVTAVLKLRQATAPSLRLKSRDRNASFAIPTTQLLIDFVRGSRQVFYSKFQSKIFLGDVCRALKRSKTRR